MFAEWECHPKITARHITRNSQLHRASTFKIVARNIALYSQLHHASTLKFVARHIARNSQLHRAFTFKYLHVILHATANCTVGHCWCLVADRMGEILSSCYDLSTVFSSTGELCIWRHIS